MNRYITAWQVSDPKLTFHAASMAKGLMRDIQAIAGSLPKEKYEQLVETLFRDIKIRMELFVGELERLAAERRRLEKKGRRVVDQKEKNDLSSDSIRRKLLRAPEGTEHG